MLKYFFLSLCTTLLAQSAPIFYFYNRDSSALGVKTYNGEIIIPAEYSFEAVDTKKPISGRYFLMKSLKNTKEWPYSEDFILFDRTGQVFAHPLLFDNGIDYLQEGYFRYVDSLKIGFIDTKFEKSILAQFDFVTPFNEGVASFCNGCKAQKDKEIITIAGGFYGIVDNTGKILMENKSQKEVEVFLNKNADIYFNLNADEKKIQKAIEKSFLNTIQRNFPQVRKNEKLYPKIIKNAFYDAQYYTFKLYVKTEFDFEEALNINFLIDKNYLSISYIEDSDVLNIKKKNLKF